jgi:arabinogalactan oligomer/maltooligosaccharide transport system permease protein
MTQKSSIFESIKRIFLKVYNAISVGLSFAIDKIKLGFKYLFLGVKYLFIYSAELLHYLLFPIWFPLSLLKKWLYQFEVFRKFFDGKIISYIKAILSVFVWGIGQALNGQRLKAFIFFIIFIGFIGIELGTSSYFVETRAYDKLPGEDFGDDYISSIMGDYYDVISDDYTIDYPAFDAYLTSIGKSGIDIFNITEDEFISFIAQDLKENNPITYTDLSDNSVYLGIDGINISSLEQKTFYYDDNNQYFYQERTLENNTKEYVFIDLETLSIDESNILLDNSILKEVIIGENTYQAIVDNDMQYFVDVTIDGAQSYLNVETFAFDSVLVDQELVYLNDSVNTTHIVRSQTMYVDADGKYYTAQDVLGTTAKNYIETDIITGITNDQNILISDEGLVEFVKNNVVYQVEEAGVYTYFIEVDTFNDANEEINKYINISTKEVVDTIDSSATALDLVGPLYELDGMFFEYYQPGLIYLNQTLSFEGTVFTDKVKESMYVTYNQSWNTFTEEDYLRFVIKVYFEIYQDEKAEFVEAFDNFFYDKSGLFVKSYWSVFTLGTSSLVELEGYNTLKVALVGDSTNSPKIPITVLPSVPIMGHVSAQLMIEGIIGIIVSLMFFIFMIWSVRDAYKISESKRKKEKVLIDTEYIVETFEKGFAYFILSPAMVVLSFISLMPIAFGFLIAFTNIAGKKSLIETFDYVGFSNFVALFDFTGTLGATFGAAFWRVLGWTIIWAIFSTATVFFGGFFQAIVLNSEKVVFRKFWRTVLILPWAIPALLSQMIFKVMFAETGYINQLAREVGLYDLFTSWGILGQPFDALNGFQQLFYLGNQNIQWFTNPSNPTFVRIVLIVVNIWLGFPYFMALMTGVMTAIDKTLYEAADIDGASGGQKLTKITMPLVLYSTAPILIMTFSGNFNNFGVIYFITGGGPNDGNYNRGYAGDTDILISWMYKLTVDEAIYNMASVFSVLIFFFVGTVTAWNLSRTRAFTED